MIFAIINGGLGLQYAGNTVQAEKGYGIVVGVFSLAYICILVWWYMKRNKQVEQGKSDGSVVVARSTQLESDDPAPSKKEATTEVNEV
jgi:predicted Co/Zn/Cd cation transporter (cation efflux family)